MSGVRHLLFRVYPGTSLGDGSNMLLCRVLPGKTYGVNPTASRSEWASTAIGCKPTPTATGRSSSLIHVAPKQILITSYASNEMDGTKMRMTGRRPDRHAPRSASSLRGIRRCGTLIIIHYPSVFSSPFWVSYGPRDLPRFTASPPLSQPDSRRTAVTITPGLNDKFPLQGCSRASS